MANGGFSNTIGVPDPTNLGPSLVEEVLGSLQEMTSKFMRCSLS
jgi:hypothetical protein